MLQIKGIENNQQTDKDGSIKNPGSEAGIKYILLVNWLLYFLRWLFPCVTKHIQYYLCAGRNNNFVKPLHRSFKNGQLFTKCPVFCKASSIAFVCSSEVSLYKYNKRSSGVKMVIGKPIKCPKIKLSLVAVIVNVRYINGGGLPYCVGNANYWYYRVFPI